MKQHLDKLPEKKKVPLGSLYMNEGLKADGYNQGIDDCTNALPDVIESVLEEVIKDMTARMEHEDYVSCYVCDETLYHLTQLQAEVSNKDV